jgi:hypothetical protein
MTAQRRFSMCEHILAVVILTELVMGDVLGGVSSMRTAVTDGSYEF